MKCVVAKSEAARRFAGLCAWGCGLMRKQAHGALGRNDRAGVRLCLQSHALVFFITVYTVAATGWRGAVGFALQIAVDLVMADLLLATVGK